MAAVTNYPKNFADGRFVDHSGLVTHAWPTKYSNGRCICYTLYINNIVLKHDSYHDYEFYGVKLVTIVKKANKELEITETRNEASSEITFKFYVNEKPKTKFGTTYYLMWGKTIVDNTPKPISAIEGGFGGKDTDWTGSPQQIQTVKAATDVLNKLYNQTRRYWTLFNDEGVIILFELEKSQSLFWFHPTKGAKVLDCTRSNGYLFLCENPKLKIDALNHTINGITATSTFFDGERYK